MSTIQPTVYISRGLIKLNIFENEIIYFQNRKLRVNLLDSYDLRNYNFRCYRTFEEDKYDFI